MTEREREREENVAVDERNEDFLLLGRFECVLLLTSCLYYSTVFCTFCIFPSQICILTVAAAGTVTTMYSTSDKSSGILKHF